MNIADYKPREDCKGLILFHGSPYKVLDIKDRENPAYSYDVISISEHPEISERIKEKLTLDKPSCKIVSKVLVSFKKNHDIQATHIGMGVTEHDWNVLADIRDVMSKYDYNALLVTDYQNMEILEIEKIEGGLLKTEKGDYRTKFPTIRASKTKKPSCRYYCCSA